MVRVLIVDDSSTSRMLLKHIINREPDMQVVGEALDGKQAVEKVRKLRPDVILMDIVMPEMDGLEATEEVMGVQPTPIVMISGTIQGRETEMAFQSIKKGALTLLSKPDGIDHPDFEAQAAKLVSTLRVMSDVRVIHHTNKRKVQQPSAQPESMLRQTIEATPEIVGIVSSTGGPAALAEMLQYLPASFPLPIVIVQHIAKEFLPSLTSWLNTVSPLTVQPAPIGKAPQAGHVYLAPVGQHLILSKRRVFSQVDQPQTTHMPSGTILLESIAEQYGAAAIGIVLTGMGTDGAQGLYAMRQRGAVTIAQNQATSAVYGMPAEASRLGAAQYSLALSMISTFLNDLVERETNG